MTQTSNFVFGRYVRSATEAEQLVAASDRERASHPSREPGVRIRAMRRGAGVEYVAAQLCVELCRRGYAYAWDVALAAAIGSGRIDEGARSVGIPEAIVKVAELTVGEIADVVIGQRLTMAEPDRETAARSWSEIAADDPHGDDWYDAELDARAGERKARDRRFWGMRNRAMRDKLERGECVDVSTFRRVSANWHTFESNPLYVIPDDVFQDDVDWCDADTEEWIWSIGRHTVTREIHASKSADLYQNDFYHCLFLR